MCVLMYNYLDDKDMMLVLFEYFILSQYFFCKIRTRYRYCHYICSAIEFNRFTKQKTVQ